MKKITILLAFIFPSILFAQSVAINNDGSLPDNNAILDIKSNSKGILIPRLTTAQRTAMIVPSIGLTVYDTNTNSFWMFRGGPNGGWTEMAHNQQLFWTNNGPDIYNNNLGNVGIGTNTPASKLTIDGTDPVIGMLNNGLATGFIQANGFDMKIGTHPDNPVGDIVFQPKGIDKIWITENGRMGINTTSPPSLLSINGTNSDNARIDFAYNNIDKSYIYHNSNAFTLGTYNDNLNGYFNFQTKGTTRMYIEPEGTVVIGSNNSSSPLTVNTTDIAIQFQNSNTNYGYVKLQGNDMILGSERPFGALRFNTNGEERMRITNLGAVSIGTTSTSSSFLTVGENGNGRSGISFRGIVNDAYRGALYYTATGGVLECLDGDLIINAGGIGFKLFEDGNFAMGGFTKATGYRLSVHGKVIATEYTTMPIFNWPDYVFADDYKLKPLAEVKKFITENKHLPNIPSAKEIEKNGIELGAMSKNLIEKVEELTLYIIQINETNIELQKQIDELKKNNKK